ncbi:MAG: metal-dependent hydrolase, partial [bacterium]|nr:metal-dependent hydrolase [bacterium]
MPSLITHAVVGLAAGSAFPEKQRTGGFWLLTILLPMLPDADVIGFKFGVSYGDFLGHRGFFHSLFFAIIAALLVGILFSRGKKLYSKEWNTYVLYFFLLTGTHGVLDAFTNGGLGIALLAPFDNARYFFPWQPIAVSPIG